MKSLIVYHAGGKWFGSEVEWERSGSGFYRKVAGLVIPQSRAEIVQFAKDNGYSIEWRGRIPADAPAGSS